jgi:type II secretion system protein C
MATLYDRDTHVVGIYRIHDPIRESIELVSIGPGYVVIQNEGRLERVAFGADTAPAPRPKKSTGKPPEPTSADRYEGRVQCSDEHTCQVDRALVDELFANPMVLAKELRASPHTVDGELAGFRLHGIRRGSLPKKLGLENGDAIVELGGQRLSSADELLTMAMKLRRASRVSATVLRKGKRIEKTLEVRD